MLRNMANVLVVGAGITGAATAYLLRQCVSGIDKIVIWDKGRGAGGRMSTTRCPEDTSNKADLGAQYITLKESYFHRRSQLYDELLENEVLIKMTGKVEGPNNFDEPGARHYVAPEGVSSLVKYFLERSGSETTFQHTVTDVNFDGENAITVTTKEGVTGTFDLVVLTMPVPQILQLKGSVQDCIEKEVELKERLQAVTYSSRYALAMFFPLWEPLDIPWSARYLDGDIRYMAVDQIKRGADDAHETGRALVVHTSVPYGLRRLEDNMEDVKSDLLGKVKQILPSLPPEMSTKIQRWRYSQIHKAYHGTPGSVLLSKNPPVVLAGDAFTHSGFDGCLDSAITVVDMVQAALPADDHISPSCGTFW